MPTTRKQAAEKSEDASVSGGGKASAKSTNVSSTTREIPQKRKAGNEASQNTSAPPPSKEAKETKPSSDPKPSKGTTKPSASDTSATEESKPKSSTKTQDDEKTALAQNPPRSTPAELNLSTPLQADAQTVFALLLAAELSSAVISHDIAFKTARRVIEEGWNDVRKLRESTWERRIEVLTEGGYTRYREREAKFLGEMAELICEKYDGDLNNLSKAAGEDPEKLRGLLKEIKGFGEVAADIFCRDAQVLWTYLVPFADKKALQAAEKRGLGSSAEELFEAVGKDREKLANLCTSLTLGDLEGK